VGISILTTADDMLQMNEVTVKILTSVKDWQWKKNLPPMYSCYGVTDESRIAFVKTFDR